MSVCGIKANPKFIFFHSPQNVYGNNNIFWKLAFSTVCQLNRLECVWFSYLYQRRTQKSLNRHMNCIGQRLWHGIIKSNRFTMIPLIWFVLFALLSFYSSYESKICTHGCCSVFGARYFYRFMCIVSDNHIPCCEELPAYVHVSISFSLTLKAHTQPHDKWYSKGYLCSP